MAQFIIQRTLQNQKTEILCNLTSGATAFVRSDFEYIIDWRVFHSIIAAKRWLKSFGQVEPPENKAPNFFYNHAYYAIQQLNPEIFG